MGRADGWGGRLNRGANQIRRQKMIKPARQNPQPTHMISRGKIAGLEGHTDGGGGDLIPASLIYAAENGQYGPTKLPTNQHMIFPEKYRSFKGARRRWGGNALISAHLKYEAKMANLARRNCHRTPHDFLEKNRRIIGTRFRMGGNDLISAHLNYDAENDHDGPKKFANNPRGISVGNRRPRGTHRRRGGVSLIPAYLKYDAGNRTIS